MRSTARSLSLTVLAVLIAFASTLLVVGAQNSDAAGPIGPITTNNGQSACVEFGSCSTANNAATTETQLSPVTSPASTQNFAPATNVIESINSVSQLAKTGAQAAYSSRVANGQGSGNRPDGATSAIDTASVIAGSPPSANSATSSAKSSGNAASSLAIWYRSVTSLWPAATLFVGLIAGGAFVL